jgi:hypothetical protein
MLNEQNAYLRTPPCGEARLLLRCRTSSLNFGDYSLPLSLQDLSLELWEIHHSLSGPSCEGSLGAVRSSRTLLLLSLVFKKRSSSLVSHPRTGVNSGEKIF